MLISKPIFNDLDRLLALATRMRALPAAMKRVGKRFIPRVTVRWRTTECQVCHIDRGRNVRYSRCPECDRPTPPERKICSHNRLAVDCGKCGK